MKLITKYIFPLLLIFVIFDFFWNVQEIHNQPLQGDIVPLVLPDKGNAPVLKDPFGVKALRSETYHPNINRFFSTVTLYSLFHSAPFALQKIVGPVQSLYLTATIFKVLAYVGFLMFLTRVIVGRKAVRKDWILSLFVLTPFMQTGGYLGNIELIGGSIVYHCFYGFPFLLLLIWTLPFFDTYRTGKTLPSKPWKIVLLIGLTIFCSFSSALMPGVVLIGGGLYLGNIVLRQVILFFGGEKPVSLASLLNHQHLLLLFFMLLSLYSFYLGGFNSEAVNDYSISERYQKLWYGFVKFYLSIPSLPIIWFTILINAYLLKRNNILVWGRPFGKIIGPLAIFIFIYILLLPLGGYRSYREVILRGDILIPTTILVFFLVTLSCFTLFKNLKGKNLKNYSIYFLLLIVIFTHYDYGSAPRGKRCESTGLYEISKTEKNILTLKRNCGVMDWYGVTRPSYYKNHAKLWQYWNLTDHEVLITMPEN